MAKPPVLPGSNVTEESPVDRALQLALAGERDAALRWSAAILRDDPAMATALCVTGRLLGEGGREEAAREACTTATRRAIDLENLPLAVTAAREAGRFGADPAPLLDEVAAAFCKDSARHGHGAKPPVMLPPAASFNPLPSALTGMALNNKACQIVHECTKQLANAERPAISRVPLFSTLDRDGLRELIESLEPEWLVTGHTVIEQGVPGREAYWVARGELEAKRTGKNGQQLSLARLTGGSIFGEMALLSRSPRAGRVATVKPSIVVRIGKAKLDQIAQTHPSIALQLAEYCRDRMVQNLLKISEILRVVPEKDLPALVSKFRIRTFEQSERLVVQDELPTGLFLVASGEVAVVRREGDGDPLLLHTLGVGDVVGEVATIFRRKTSADVLAAHPTVTLFLPTEDLVGLIREHPSILAELYLLAVQRDDETRAILADEVSVAEDFDLI